LLDEALVAVHQCLQRRVRAELALRERRPRRGEFNPAAGQDACSGAGNGCPQKVPTGQAGQSFTVARLSRQ
jgi:hypothetical protein